MPKYENNGHFSDSGNEYIITKRDIQRNWYNYLWNDKYITSISQIGAGEGFSQDDMGNRIFLLTDRRLFLTVGNNTWEALGSNMEQEISDFSCTHGIGYSTIVTKKSTVSSSYTTFVPNGLEGELSILTLENTGDGLIKVEAVLYFGTQLDGPYLKQGYNTGQGGFDSTNNFIHGSYLGKFNSKYGNRFAILGSSEKIESYDTAYNCFVGKYDWEGAPEAIKNKKLTNSNVFAEKMCFAINNSITLLPGEKKEIVFVFALSDSLFKAQSVKNECCDIKNAKVKLEANIKKYQRNGRGVFIKTPDVELNHLFNYWLKYETEMGSRWARVRHNGYRDLSSDTACFGTFNPKAALINLKRVLSYQYSNGYAPRTFIDGKIADRSFSDNCVWIVFAISYLVKEIGDITILDEIVPYNDGTRDTIYNHARMAMEFLWNFKGHHDLIRIWGGDWNDSLNHAGLEGKGVSVWLSIAWCRANKEFAELALHLGKTEDYKTALMREEKMEKTIDEFGWDKEYYLYGYSDNGESFGSSDCPEGKIHLIVQLWATLAQIGSENKRKTALESVERLLDCRLGTLALAPSYTHYDENIGEMTGKPIGLFLNGGVYMHTMCWKIAVDCMMKDRTLLMRDLNRVLPFRNEIVANRAEPYVMCNSYMGEAAGERYGSAGQSWRTAANGWLVKDIVNYIFGLKPELEGLRIEPCIPKEWRCPEITKHFRDSVYHIKFINDGMNVKSIMVDDELINSDILPYEPNKKYNVLVVMGE